VADRKIQLKNNDILVLHGIKLFDLGESTGAGNSATEKISIPHNIAPFNLLFKFKMILK